MGAPEVRSICMECYVYVAAYEGTIRAGDVVTIFIDIAPIVGIIYTATIILAERFIRYLHVVMYTTKLKIQEC